MSAIQRLQVLNEGSWEFQNCPLAILWVSNVELGVSVKWDLYNVTTLV